MIHQLLDELYTADSLQRRQSLVAQIRSIISTYPKLLSDPTTRRGAGSEHDKPDGDFTVLQPDGTFSKPDVTVNNPDEEARARAAGFTVEIPAPIEPAAIQEEHVREIKPIELPEPTFEDQVTKEEPQLETQL